MSLPTFAEGNGTLEPRISVEMYELLEDYLSEEQIDDTEINCEAEYKVYDENYCLIRFGSLEDCMVKCLVSRCDFLTEIDGTKYYRLNK